MEKRRRADDIVLEMHRLAALIGPRCLPLSAISSFRGIHLARVIREILAVESAGSTDVTGNVTSNLAETSILLSMFSERFIGTPRAAVLPAGRSGFSIRQRERKREGERERERERERYRFISSRGRLARSH